MPNELDILRELISYADGMGRGDMLDLSDRDDLDPWTMTELRLLLTRERNAIDVVSRSLAHYWMETHGPSGFIDPETGVVATCTPQAGSWAIDDEDGFAEYLRSLPNDALIHTISTIRVSSVPDGVKESTLVRKGAGNPIISITNTDNPKHPKWVHRGEEGDLVSRT